MAEDFGYGQLDPFVLTSDHNVTRFIIDQVLGRVRTIMPVIVKSVKGGAIDFPPIVSVQPLVNELDGNSNSFPHGEIFGIPAFRLQGGLNAIIADPKVGDIGWLCIADRDISAVKANKGVSNPGSGRVFDFADGIYVGGILNAAPNQYFQFTDDGISIADKSGNTVAMSPAGIVVTDANGNVVTMSGSGLVLAPASGLTMITGAAEISGGLKVGTGEPSGTPSQISRILTGSLTTAFGGTIGAFSAAVDSTSVPGCDVGDFVLMYFNPGTNPALVIKGWVSAPGTVQVFAYNAFNSTTIIASDDYKVLVFGAS